MKYCTDGIYAVLFKFHSGGPTRIKNCHKSNTSKMNQDTFYIQNINNALLPMTKFSSHGCLNQVNKISTTLGLGPTGYVTMFYNM